MERALDDWTGEIVQARQVKELHVYRCLSCGEDVLLAPGPRPHESAFRHRHAYDQGCAEFQEPGGHLDRAWQVAAARRRQPALCAALRRAGGRLSWRVELFLPTFQGHFDTFEILHDVHPGWRVPAELPPEGARFEVLPVEGGFSATALDHGEPVETCPRDGPLGLLSRRFANVFDLNAGGRLLDIDTPLVFGRDYLALAPAFRQLPLHPHVELRELVPPSPSPPFSLWRAYLLRLDDAAAADEWCGQQLRRGMSLPSARLDLVTPPAAGELADGTLVVPAGERVVLAVRGRPGQHLPPALLVRREPAQAPRGVCLGPSAEPPVYIDLGPLQPGAYTVVAPASPSLALSLRAATVVAPEVPAVDLTLTDARGGHHVLGLDEAGASLALAEVVAGRSRLERVELPEGASLTLLRRSAADAPWEVWPIPAGHRWQDALEDCLGTHPVALRLDGGAFGRAEWRLPAVRPAASPPASVERRELPAALRRRLLWLFQARLLYKTLSPGSALGLAGPGAPAALAEADRQLVRRLREMASWPAPLLAPARAAARDLNRFLENDR